MNGHYPVDDQMLNYTLYQPVGVCALVSPWNVPFMTATWKTAPCLALGNTAVLKRAVAADRRPARHMLALEAGIPPGVMWCDDAGSACAGVEAGIPPGVLNVVQGYGAMRAEEEGARVLAGGPELPPPAGAAGWRQLRASHGAGRRGQPHALRPGRDLRPGRLPAALQGRGRRPDAGQRCEVRTGVLHLDPRYRPRASAGARHRGRHGVHQQPERARPAPAFRRQGIGHGGKAANTATRYSPRSRTSAFPWAAITSRAGACRPSFISPQHKTRTRRQTPWASSRW